ncbi:MULTISPECIES: carbohydrate kinase family protein [Limimaricola]|uniref:Carbohydrate kinase family protein n=1 Tax=Limimaricola litoreus TaxID=2955316 RepID=A0A9X2JQ29_9RHOB|nr:MULTISPECIES: carbohydrate kinase family protein [Limimaricola]MCP1167131.1 carbohydrate kinase family protein [Limimaricola litoreus]
MPPVSRPPLLLCVGDIDMDIIIRVPEPPGRDQKVDGERVAQTPGGMAANVAVGARRLGTPVRMLGAVGDDAMGREALAALTTEGLDLDHVVTRANTPTFFCVIMVDRAGEKSLVKAISEAYLPRVTDLTPAAFEGATHVHLTFTRPELVAATVARARAVGATVSLDLEAADLPPPGAGIGALLKDIDLLFVSEHSRAEAERRFGSLATRDDQAIATTLSARGARLERGGTCHEVPGHEVEVVDTSGAGDAFAAAFLHTWLQGRDDLIALRFANAAAALSTRAYGAQAGLARLEEVEALMHHISDRRTHA